MKVLNAIIFKLVFVNRMLFSQFLFFSTFFIFNIFRWGGMGKKEEERIEEKGEEENTWKQGYIYIYTFIQGDLSKKRFMAFFFQHFLPFFWGWLNFTQNI